LQGTPKILRQVGHILLQLPYMDARQPRQFLIADDCFELISLIPMSTLWVQSGGPLRRFYGSKILGFITRYKVERHGYKLDMAADGTCSTARKYRIRVVARCTQVFNSSKQYISVCYFEVWLYFSLQDYCWMFITTFFAFLLSRTSSAAHKSRRLCCKTCPKPQGFWKEYQ